MIKIYSPLLKKKGGGPNGQFENSENSENSEISENLEIFFQDF